MAELIQRIIYFYEIGVGGKGRNSTDAIAYIKNTFQYIIELNKSQAPNRFFKLSGDMVAIIDAKFNAETKQIEGKIVKVRMDMFPELLNTQDNSIKDIDAKEEEGLLEVAHFIIYHDKTAIMAIEYNQYGAKYVDICKYLRYIGTLMGQSENLVATSIVRDTLSSFERRIQRCASFDVKVHKDNIARIREADDELFTVMDIANKFGESEYVEIELNFDYKTKVETKKIKEKIGKIIAWLMGNNQRVNYFEKLSLNAEDIDKDNKLEVFDLLSDKLKSVVSVQRRGRTRAVFSTHMFHILQEELNYKIINPIN